MVNITNKDIYMTKGDTVKISLDIRDKNGNLYSMQSGDQIRMAVRKHCSNKDEFAITSDNKDIVIDADKTKNMYVGTYEYDIQLTFANGEVNTIVPLHKFVVQKEVS